MLNQSNFRIVRKFDGVLPRETLVKCFESIFSHSTQLAEFLLAEARIKMKIAAKLGTLSLNVSIINVIKMTEFFLGFWCDYGKLYQDP